MIPAAVASGLVARWAHYYSDNKNVSAAVTFLHLSGILLGGGLAVAADRATLRLAPTGDRRRELAELAAVHRAVLAGLAVTLVSGLLMMFADLDTYLGSVVFWTKMGLIVILLVNGGFRWRAERGVRDARPGAEVWLKRTSVSSLALWFAVLLAGTMLTTIS
ncbi:MAG TPA: hypothetical protein VFK78_03950 [Gemmatimonadales bacterium]|nr:hypothetical protein [Gemmatimonadales bacterium]